MAATLRTTASQDLNPKQNAIAPSSVSQGQEKWGEWRWRGFRRGSVWGECGTGVAMPAVIFGLPVNETSDSRSAGVGGGEENALMLYIRYSIQQHVLLLISLLKGLLTTSKGTTFGAGKQTVLLCFLCEKTRARILCCGRSWSDNVNSPCS